MTASYKAAAYDQVARTNMEVGTPRMRLRSAAQIDRVDAQWMLTDAQMATFRTWYYDPINGAAAGANWFTIPLAVGETGLTSVTARFLGPYQAQAMPSLLWTLTGQMEIRYA
jgi:hypothetical protein